jgi:hypothetical protein
MISNSITKIKEYIYIYKIEKKKLIKKKKKKGEEEELTLSSLLVLRRIPAILIPQVSFITSGPPMPTF